jgi:hypothetical protein
VKKLYVGNLSFPVTEDVVTSGHLVGEHYSGTRSFFQRTSRIWLRRGGQR